MHLNNNNFIPADFLSDTTLTPQAGVFAEKGGTNSEIKYYCYPSGEIKTVACYGAKKSGFTYNEAVEKMHDIIRYQEKLEKRQISMPAIENIVIEYDQLRERAMVVKTSPWSGQDIYKIVQKLDPVSDRGRIMHLVVEICEILKLVCQDRKVGWDTNIGIDPRCSNFTFDGNGKMWFVDLFPTRYRKHGQPIVEWPEPKNEIGRKLGYFKHFDVRGIILCTTAQLARVKPELKSAFEDLVIKEIGEVMSQEEKNDFFQELGRTPWMRLRQIIENKQTLHQNDFEKAKQIILQSLDNEIFGVDYNIYTLRELALELCASGYMSKEEVEDYFRQSHFEDELPRVLIDKLQNLLINTLTNFIL